MPNNESLKAIGRGTVVIHDNKNKITLNNVLHVPELKGNFISISKIIESGKVVIFKDNYVHVKDLKNNLILKSFNNNDIILYEYERNRCINLEIKKFNGLASEVRAY